MEKSVLKQGNFNALAFAPGARKKYNIDVKEVIVHCLSK